ncbi:MAG TPA: L-aspartate oxidase [Acidimicrobiales bacterium]|nr:L-aspartate oxidase [Acidimicrobiales bacterium]
MTPSPSGGTRARAPGPFDVLIVGSGVAGLSAAVRLADAPEPLNVGVLTKGELSQSATRWAQGGVAAVLGGDEDSTDLHLADTLAAGAGLCDVDAVRVLVDEGPARVNELIAMGAAFDREATGDLALAREGGHSRPRVVHAGGAATGAEVERALVEAARSSAGAVLERWFALDLVIEGGRCRGVVARPPLGDPVEIRAGHVVLATGGGGQLFAVTTNPPEATGDGVAMALRAGIPVADVEFIQFHPTALHHPAMPRPLLSEALRGHGALLRDVHGERFVDELAPRDVVSHAMSERMARDGADHLWLDATGLDNFGVRFPTIASSLAQVGLDPAVDWLPIAPAAHHLSGGVVTDLFGATAMAGLWAAGETACTGVHGANRLASNSLLEGMVFGARMAEAIASGVPGPSVTGAMRTVLGDGTEEIAGRPADRPLPITLERAVGADERGAPADLGKSRVRLQLAMTTGAGVVRTASSLEGAWVALEEGADAWRRSGERDTVAGDELRNLVTVASAVLVSATQRQESRGAHTRADFPRTDPAWRCRLIHAGPPRRG